MMNFCGRNFHKIAFASLITGVSVLIAPLTQAQSIYISNWGFESSLKNWQTSGRVTISPTSRVGDFSAKISSEDGLIKRRVKVEKNTNYELSAYIRGAGTLGVEIGGVTNLNSRESGSGWKKHH